MDNTVHPIFDGVELSNSEACWDWVGWYGENADQEGGSSFSFSRGPGRLNIDMCVGVQMTAIVNMVTQIMNGST